MDPLTLITVFTVVGPFVTATAKKLFGFGHIQNPAIKGTLSEALNLILGLGASIANEAAKQCPMPSPACAINWKAAIIAGLAAGAGSSLVRNTDQNFVGVAETLIRLKSSLMGKDAPKEN